MSPQGRVAGKAAIVVGAGQTPGETIGNGRATAILLAREGARVLCVDRRLESAEETVAMIQAEGGEALAFRADIAVPEDCAALVAAGVSQLGGLDILHNNVGIGAGDAPLHKLEEDAWDRILDVSLKGMWLTLRAAVPVMRERGGGAIVNISSLAAIAAAGNLTAYGVAKAGVNKLTTTVAAANGRYGLRCNAIMPGLMDTPMAVDAVARATGQTREAVRAPRDANVPLGGRMGTAWDVAYASLFLASDEARFITGAILPVDGGGSVRVG